MDIPRHHFLADATFAGDQDRGVGGGDLVGERLDLHHRRVLRDEWAIIIGNSRKHSGDQFGIGRQRDEFAGAGADGGGGGGGGGGDAAGDDGGDNALTFHGCNQRHDVFVNIDHDNVSAPSGAQQVHRHFGVVCM